MDEEDYKQFLKEAKKLKMTMSSFIRSCVKKY